MDTSAVRTPAGAPWRLRPWSGDPRIGHLIFLDHGRLPTDAELAAALDRAARHRFTAVRTSAMFPAAAALLERIGFAPIDHLALLRLDALGHRRLARPARPTRPLRPWQRRAAAEVDRAAFGTEWGNDAGGLAEIQRATPRQRSRWVPGPSGGRGHARAHRLAGMAISGAAGRTGYLQRLAVHPHAQRTGLATVLVEDALGWMQRLGLTEVLVNTGVTNRPALELYQRMGFVRLPEVLTIAEYPFDTTLDTEAAQR